MRTVGIVLIVIGIIMMVITGFNYMQRDKVVDLGKVEVTKETEKPVRWSPIVGAVLLVGGLVVILSSKKGTGPSAA